MSQPDTPPTADGKSAPPRKIDSISGAEFPTTANSPFPDGFDIEAARQECKHLLDQLSDGNDPDESDPKYPLLAMLQEREATLQQEKATHERNRARMRDGGGARGNRPDRPSFFKEALGQRLGQLSNNRAITFHLESTQRLIAGRSFQDGAHGIPSLFAYARAVKMLWYLTAQNNPFADLALIRLDEKIVDVAAALKKCESEFRSKLEVRQKMGIEDEIVRSQKPGKIEGLHFRTPYGFVGSNVVMHFDFACRCVMTCEIAGLVTRKAAAATRFDMQRRIRNLFNFAIRLSQVIHADDRLKAAKRPDFLAQPLPPEMSLALAASEKFLGQMPDRVLAGEVRPAHFAGEIDVTKATATGA